MENVIAFDRTPPAQQINQSFPTVNTFDVFDSLIARRCIVPQSIFLQVALRHNYPMFVEHRQAAERSLANVPYTIDDIYRAFATLLNISTEEAERFKKTEIACEMESIIPIRENLQRVADGDVLISDMYLPVPIIRQMLLNAGLTKHVSLIVTNHGKSQGYVWEQIIRQVSIRKHLGDHPYSDIAVPAKFAIPTEQTLAWRPTAIERLFIEIGLRDLAETLREVRLSTWEHDPIYRRLQLIQLQYNIPMLLFATLQLVRLTKRLGLSKILFSSRDCYLWQRLFDAVAPSLEYSGKAQYFYTSRKTRIKPSTSYLSYAQQSIEEQSVVVDICGTGWSIAVLLQRLGLKNAHVFLIHQFPKNPVFEQRQQTPSEYPVHALQHTDFGLNVVEQCNTAPYGSVVDVKEVLGTPIPIFDQDSRSSYVLKAIETQCRVFEQVVALLQRRPLGRLAQLDDATIARVTEQIHQQWRKESVLWQLFAEDLQTENRGFATWLQTSEKSPTAA